MFPLTWPSRVTHARLSATDKLPPGKFVFCPSIQGRPIKAAWFDVLVFDPRFGGQNCLSVVQALQAEFGNLMAVRQNLCVQIGVCWLQRLNWQARSW